MSTKKIAASTLWQIMSQCVMAALSILTVKFTALGLSQELFGHYNSAYGYLQLFGILADFGLYAVAVREISRAGAERPKVLGALLLLRAITLTIALSIALTIAWSLPAWRGTPLPLGITIAALVPFFTLLAGMLRVVFQVEYRMHFVFIAEVLQRVLTAGLMGLFIAMGVRGSEDVGTYHLFLFVGGIGAFVLFSLSIACGWKFFGVALRPEYSLVRDLARKAAPFGIAYLCIAIFRQFDVTLIALLRKDFAVQNAYYGPVLRMMDMGFLLPTFLLNSALPLLSGRQAEGEDTRSMLGKTLLMVLIIGTISGLISLFWSRPLTSLLTTTEYLSTPEYPGSDTALRLLALPMFLNGLLLYAFYVLLAEHRSRALVMTLAGVASVSLVMNIVLIPLYGFVGACATSIWMSVVAVSFLLPLSFQNSAPKLPESALIRLVSFAFVFAALLASTLPILTTDTRTALGLIALGLLVPLLLIGTGNVRSLGLR